MAVTPGEGQRPPPLPASAPLDIAPGDQAGQHTAPGARMHPGRRPPDRPGRSTLPPPARMRTTRPPPPHRPPTRARRAHAHARAPAPGPRGGVPRGWFRIHIPVRLAKIFFGFGRFRGVAVLAGFPQVAVGCSVDCCGCFWAVVVCAGGVGLSRVGVSPAFAVAQLGCASHVVLAPRCLWPGSPRPFPPKLI